MNKRTTKLALSSLFLSIGLLLPFLTGQIPAIAKIALPMHYPIFLCGLILGPKPGLLIGIICPLLRSLLFSMPMFYPTAIAMAVELGAYGLIAGLIYHCRKEKNLFDIYLSIIPAMLAGRILGGITTALLLGLKGSDYSMSIFLASYFINCAAGIVAELLLIPPITRFLASSITK